MSRKKVLLDESVLATYKDGSQQTFASITEASKATGLTEASIKHRCNSGTGGKSKDGITFIWADEHTRKSKQAKRNKSKGNRFELEVINKLKELGFSGVVSSRSQNKLADANKVDIIDMTGQLDINIQCKDCQNTPNYFTIRDACTDKEHEFCLAWKKSSTGGSIGTVAIIDINFFYKLLKSYYNV